MNLLPHVMNKIIQVAVKQVVLIRISEVSSSCAVNVGVCGIFPVLLRLRLSEIIHSGLLAIGVDEAIIICNPMSNVWHHFTVFLQSNQQ